MTNPIVGAVLLFGVGLFAGGINVIAGGGSFLTLPLMIFLGLPPTVANGTNRLAIITQNIGATISFHRRGLIDRKWFVLALWPSVLGSLLGTVAAIRIGDLAFQRVLAVTMVAITAWTLWRPVSPHGGEAGAPPAGTRRLLFLGAWFLVGFYGGMVQAGVGFLILAVTSAVGMDLIRGNAIKVALVLAFTPLALVLFAANGKVDWLMALWLAAGNWLGGILGVRLQVLKGHAWVRNVVTVTIVVFALRLLIAD